MSGPPSVTLGGRRRAAVAAEVSPQRGSSSATPPPSCGAYCFTPAVVCPARTALSCVENGWIVPVEHIEEEEEEMRKKVRVKDSLSVSVHLFQTDRFLPGQNLLY